MRFSFIKDLHNDVCMYHVSAVIFACHSTIFFSKPQLILIIKIDRATLFAPHYNWLIFITNCRDAVTGIRTLGTVKTKYSTSARSIVKSFTDNYETLFNFETNSVTQFLSFGSIPLLMQPSFSACCHWKSKVGDQKFKLYDMVLLSNLKADLISVDCILYQLPLKHSVPWLHKVDNKSTEYSFRTVATVEENTECRNVAS